MTPEDPVRLLYRDDRVLVCVKPAGVLSTDEPGGMPSLLRAAIGGDAAVVKSVHRLDRAVGGVMVYAASKRAAADLSRQIAEGAFRKEYRAVVRGAPEAESLTMRDWLLRDRAARMTRVVPADTPGAQEAVLDCRVLGTAGALSCLAVTLHTGRTHQIRCQLSHRGLPIVGDRRYGAPDAAEHIALWSCAVGFFHPRTGQRMEFACPPPEIWPWTEFDIR